MILDDIVAAKLKRIAQQKQDLPMDALLEKVEASGEKQPGRFQQALQRPGLSVIAEVKKASPSKGIIAKDFDPEGIARQYQTGGADAISVLTEEDFFQGSNAYLKAVKKVVNIPVLRKDFIVDIWQIYEARQIGADAILLISAILTEKQMHDFRETAEALGMCTLVESHNEEELKKALGSGANIVGINNRNLKTFDVTLKTTERLAAMIPSGKTVVSESGILTADDAATVVQMGADAVLVGESLMRAANVPEKLAELKAAGVAKR